MAATVYRSDGNNWIHTGNLTVCRSDGNNLMAAATSTDPVNPPGSRGLGQKPWQLLGVLSVKPFYTSASGGLGEEGWDLLSADVHNLLGFYELMDMKSLHEILEC